MACFAEAICQVAVMNCGSPMHHEPKWRKVFVSKLNTFQGRLGAAWVNFRKLNARKLSHARPTNLSDGWSADITAT
eukprot:4368582-Amphidinium_carterae.2